MKKETQYHDPQDIARIKPNKQIHSRINWLRIWLSEQKDLTEQAFAHDMSATDQKNQERIRQIRIGGRAGSHSF